MFNCALDAKLSVCDFVKLRVSDVALVGSLRLRPSFSRRRDGLFRLRSQSLPEMRSPPAGPMLHPVRPLYLWTGVPPRRAREVSGLMVSMPEADTLAYYVRE